MDPSGKKRNKITGAYTICGDRTQAIDFEDVELAPPAGFLGVNYTRYV